MKERIHRVKIFISFYLTLPLFVFMVLISGIRALGKPPHQAFGKASEVAGISESGIAPTDYIKAERANPDGTFPIVSKDLSRDENILNATDETVDEEELLSMPLPHGSELPTVLIVHTHATECYADSNRSFGSADVDGNYGYYTANSQTRTTDTDRNMVAIGEIFCRELSKNGIEAVQCRVLHDEDDYNSAYANSRESILKYLDRFPTIKYVIDIHRDSLGEDGGDKIKTRADGIEDCAQVMLVAGCNGKGVVYPLWKENLSVALKYKKVMDDKYPSLSRPIYLRYSRYNLDLLSGSMLLEIGSCANTFDEAAKAAELAAQCFAELLK